MNKVDIYTIGIVEVVSLTILTVLYCFNKIEFATLIAIVTWIKSCVIVRILAEKGD